MADLFTDTQLEGINWLEANPHSYLADPPGYGKTRQLLAACSEEGMLTVVCPAAIRDAQVWQREAATIGFDIPLRVMSYHELAKTPVTPGSAVVFDEAHRFKNRKTGWTANGLAGAAEAERVHLASGTPTPNGYLPELYNQLRLINPAIPASYWKWVQQWFVVTASRYTQWDVPGDLLACSPRCDPDSDCEHREEFWRANAGGLMLRRPESDLNLPEAAGVDTPLDTPMTAEQAKVYKRLRKDLLAEVPGEGVTIEALNHSQLWAQLWRASTGLSCIDNDPSLDRHSGKAALIRELLPDRSHPTLLACWFRNTAQFMARICDELGLRYAMFGASTPARERAWAVDEFQAGRLDVMVASIGVVQEGLTLTAADQAIMVERAWTPGVNEQVVKRLVRRGQDKHVAVRQLVAPGSIDSGQWGVIHSKERRIKTTMTRAELERLL